MKQLKLIRKSKNPYDPMTPPFPIKTDAPSMGHPSPPPPYYYYLKMDPPHPPQQKKKLLPLKNKAPFQKMISREKS